MNSENNTFSVSKAEDSSGFLLWQVTNLWQREIRKVLAPYNLTHSQFVLLASIHWLNLQKHEVTQILLSAHSKIDPMTTSTVLRTLQKKGLVVRQEHQTDTRAKIMFLSETGISLVKEAVVTVEQFDREFFSVLGQEAELFNKQLITLMRNR